MNKGMYSSSTGNWSTPQAFFDMLDNYFNFELDVCASIGNNKCLHYFDEADNGLEQDWKKVNWLNPPYGKEIGNWIKKAYEESKKGNITVLLVPSRTDTKWFQDYCFKYGEVIFIKGRLKFGGSKNSAPFPSAIVIFGGKNKDGYRTIENNATIFSGPTISELNKVQPLSEEFIIKSKNGKRFAVAKDRAKAISILKQNLGTYSTNDYSKLTDDELINLLKHYDLA